MRQTSQPTNPSTDHLPLLLRGILLAFALLGAAYSVAVPIFEASDEVWHYPMVEHIARTWTLPVQPTEPGASSGPWRQEGSQPPLYYAIGAALTAWIDTGDMAQVRHLNPHVAAGEITPDGSNPNLVVHNPALERFPWRGTVLAVHVVRLFSVALGVWAVYLTWALVRELYPARPHLALAAAATHAFTPMYLFISASVNNDNLIVPLCSLALLLMVRRVKAAGWESGKSANRHITDHESRITDHGSPITDHKSRITNRQSPIANRAAYITLGVVIGLAILTKASGIGLLPLLGATVAWEAWQEMRKAPPRSRRSRNLRSSNIHPGHDAPGSCGHPTFPSALRRGPSATILLALARLLLALAPVLAITGWWFARNARLYGDWLGFNAFYAVLGTRDVPADFAQLWAERFAFAAGYWGNFGGLNVPLPGWVYTALNVVAAVAAVGLILGLARWLAGKAEPLARKLWPFAWSGATAARALAWAWPAAVFVSWTRWATVTWSSQGRLIFSAIPLWSLALVMGVGEIANRKSAIANGVLPAFLLILCAVALPAWILPAYQPPRASDAAPPQEHVVTFGDALRLRGFDVHSAAVRPGEAVALTLYWEALAPTAADHSLFIHVLGEGERIVAQRDTFPGRGLLSTTWLEPGYRWAERYVISLPPTAYAPDTLTLAVGMYETASGARLPAYDARGTPLGEATHFAGSEPTALVPHPGAVPNPIRVRFGEGMVLAGYDVSDLDAARGQRLAVTLHWACQAPVDGDYTISVQLLDAQWRKAGQSDAWPLDGAAPTSTWAVGQRIEERRELTLAPDAPPGVYDLRIAVYRADEDGTLIHLPVVWAEGQMPAKALVLTRIRVQ